MNDLDFLTLLEAIERQLGQGDQSASGFPFPVWPLVGPDVAREIIAEVEGSKENTDKYTEVERLLKSEFGAQVLPTWWNPFAAFFWQFHNSIRVFQFCTQLTPLGRNKLISFLPEMKKWLLSRMFENITELVDRVSLEELSRRLDSILELGDARTRRAIVEKIEKKIGRSLSSSERSRADPVVSEIAGLHPRQFS